MEEGDRSAQPSRPFAIGYVRAYAQACSASTGTPPPAASRRETPDLSDDLLRNPVGVAHEKPKRSPLIFALIGLVVSGVVLWNVVQRTMHAGGARGAALPPPPLTTPPLRRPPPIRAPSRSASPRLRLRNRTCPKPIQRRVPASIGPVDAKPVDPDPAATAAGGPRSAALSGLYAAFDLPGQGHRSTARQRYAPAAVVLQAHKPASLIVRGAGGSGLFRPPARRRRSLTRAPLGGEGH